MQEASDLSRRKVRHLLAESIEILVLEKIECGERLPNAILLRLNFSYFELLLSNLVQFYRCEDVLDRSYSLIMRSWFGFGSGSVVTSTFAQEVRSPV